MKQEIKENPVRPLSSWLSELGITSVTGWRWRKRGWIKTISIAGRQYISAEAIADFSRRAQAGEFSAVNNHSSLGHSK